jgi:cytoskeletal protein CcmA (bactofilin family)
MWTEDPSGTETPQPSKKPFATPPAEERRRLAWVGQSVVLKGELISSEDMRIDGRVEGTIQLGSHDLIIGPSGNINATVIAKTITVRGTVKGTLTASDKIEIRETASVEGDVTTPRITITDGATMKGHIQAGPKRLEAAQQPQLVAAAR